MSLVIIKAGHKIMFACRCGPEEQWRAERRLSYRGSPLGGPCCRTPCPAHILQRCGYGKQRSLRLTAFIGTRDNQDRAENTHWLVRVSRESALTIQHTCQRELLVSLFRVLKRVKCSLFTIYCPQGLLFLNLISLSNFRSSLLKLPTSQNKKGRKGKAVQLGFSILSWSCWHPERKRLGCLGILTASPGSPSHKLPGLTNHSTGHGMRYKTCGKAKQTVMRIFLTSTG